MTWVVAQSAHEIFGRSRSLLLPESILPSETNLWICQSVGSSPNQLLQCLPSTFELLQLFAHGVSGVAVFGNPCIFLLFQFQTSSGWLQCRHEPQLPTELQWYRNSQDLTLTLCNLELVWPAPFPPKKLLIPVVVGVVPPVGRGRDTSGAGLDCLNGNCDYELWLRLGT